MPQAVLIALMGAGMYAGFRLAKALSAHRSDGVEAADERSGVRDMGRLTRDPVTGIYRPER